MLSMTGYGKAEFIFSDHKTIVELRSVNSKQLDLTLKINLLYRDKEADIRAMLMQPLERGKVDVMIYTQPLDAAAPVADFTPVNWEAVNYYRRDYCAQMGVSEVPAEVMASILRFPDVMKPAAAVAVLSDEEWALLQKAVQQALDAFVSFRAQEGLSLQNMFAEKLNGIEALLAEVGPFEKGRIDRIRQHLEDNLDKLADKTKQAIDTNRLEQEMIYYLEKLDITEEKVRLANHIRYFRETMGITSSSEAVQLPTAKRSDIPISGIGKKLGFVAQEMGREINTLGSKSNQSEMQIIVVKMKDILEQIKEQVLNVL